MKMWKYLFLLCSPALSVVVGSNMNEHLLTDMSDVASLVNVNYSKPIINTSYVASVQFDMRAMGPLYNSTHMVIDVIANKHAYPEGIVKVSDWHVEIADLGDNWKVLLGHYAGPTAVVVVAVLLIAILPLAGFFWCCCYWCRVGRRRRPFDRKYDACLKGFLAIILIALITLFMFGLVCAFATDSQVESGSVEAPDSLRDSAKDVREFLNATQAHAHWLLVVNYKELADKLNAVFVTSGMTVSNKLGEYSRAVTVNTLNTMVQRLGEVREDLVIVQDHTAALRSKADELNTGLRKVKRGLLQTLARCNQPKCIALQDKHRIGQLDTEIHYSQIPDVSELLNNVTSLLDGSIQQEVEAGQRKFREIQTEIRRSVDQDIKKVQQSIEETGRRLEGISQQITDLTKRANDAVQELVSPDKLRELHQRYGPYRRYLGLAPAIALLMVTLMLVWGLTCGVCGKRPDVYGASDCCNKGSGSKCLLCGMAVMFIFGAVVTAVMVVYFIVGVAAQRFVCDPLTEPRGNRLMDDLDTFLDLEKYMFNERNDPNFNIASVMADCHRNRTIYQTLDLHRLYDLESIREEVANEVSRRVHSLQPLYPASGRDVTILSASAIEKLKQLAAVGLSDFDFDKILDALETNMTSLALDKLSQQLNSTARSLSQPEFREEAKDLMAAAAELNRILREVVTPMLHHTQTLNSTAIKLREEIRFNQMPLNEAISYLMQEASQAEHFLNRQGPERLQNLTQSLAEVVGAELQRYLSLVVYAAEHEVGPCAPLSNAYNATRDAACKKILMPTNGYWISLAWCVLLFVPIMVVAQRLSRLYLHVDPYPGPLVEAEYLYDAYADRDNVPLANAYKAEKRSGREGRQRSREGGDGSRGSGAYGGGSGGALGSGSQSQVREGAMAPPIDAHHARRYNDMAPKHWEEGPPRYHGPTEYERPPPYYYPGPNDRQ